jgi:hypothetical protein
MNPTISEIGEVCDRMAALNQALFEVLGGWVADESDPQVQQWFAVATHRHAWHAELWSCRRPTIPADARADSPELPPATGDRASWYRDRLAEVGREIAAVSARVDPTLDPSTARVVQLVTADLAALAAFH